MPGFQFKLSMTLENPSDSERVVSIPRGTLIEPESTHLSYQTAVISHDYVFRLRARETRSVILDAECWNQSLSPPRQVPGRLTNLKGDIKKQTDVWKVSSSPKSGTVLTSPSQDAHVFASLANTTPDKAVEFLAGALGRANERDARVQALKSEVACLTPSSAKLANNRRRLVEIARDPTVHPFVSASHVREFFVRWQPNEDSMAAIIALVTDVFANSSHRLARSLYDLSVELGDLLEAKRYEMRADRKHELQRLATDKFLSMVDALSLLDEIQWN
jgi:hypothetical protein